MYGSGIVRIGICDDEQTSIDCVRKCCENVCQKNKIECDYIFFRSGEDVLNYCENNSNTRIDLLFLDVEMSGISGTELLEQVKKKYQIWRIVFVTSHLESMQAAFSQKTIGFLGKPVNDKEVEKKILEVQEDMMGNAQLRFIGDAGEPVSMLVDDVFYLQGERSYTRIYINQGKIQGVLVCKTLGTLEKELEMLNFIRVHKSYLVNVAKIQYLDANVHLLECQEVIPIGRAYKNIVKKKYLEYGKWIISRK